MRHFLQNLKGIAVILFVCSVAGLYAQEAALPQLRLTYPAADLNYETYIVGTMELTDTDGSVTTLNAEFKTRGATARNYAMKPSLNMKLRDDKGKELDYNLFGLREASSFILDAMAIDRIKMRNRVCFDIWNSFSRLPYETDFNGRNGTVGKYVEVFINGTYKGIYCLSDKINRKLLGLKKPKTNDDGSLKEIRGVLYKHGTNDIENQEEPGMYNDWIIYITRWHDAWELHEPDDYACLEAWQPLLDLYDDDKYLDYNYVKDHFYLQNLADFTVHLMALAISDNWNNKNKYFSIVNIQDETRFVVTPWDLDTSLGGEYDGSRFNGDFNEWPLEEIMETAPLPFYTALKQPEFNEMLKETWREARNGAFAVDSVCSRLDSTCRLFVDSGAWQRTVEHWSKERYTELYVDDLETEIALIKDWYSKRYDTMDAFFGINDEDGVENIAVDARPADNAVYNLYGQRVASPDRPGIYIANGKKVLLRP